MIKAILTNGELTETEITDLINSHDTTGYVENENYFKGNNPTILATNDKDNSEITPNNKIPVPYGRKIALTTKNYLFSRPVNYSSNDKDYMEQVLDVFYINKNMQKTADIGLDLIVHGVAYKLFYTDVVAGALTPLYAVIYQNEMITVYDYSVEPQLIAAIRYYDQIDAADVTTTKVEVYYSDKIVKYDMSGSALSSRKEIKHDFGRVPVIEYGDDYQIGVFDSVKKIIDALDVVVSTDVNEVQRFEMLYMILIGDKLPSNPDKVKAMVQRRIFELSPGAQMSYLEKHIDADFNMQLWDRLEKLIHTMSGVPDFDSKDFAAESGVALLYKLLGFENIASQYESQFVQGEYESIDCINAILFRQKSVFDKFKFWKANKAKQVEITLQRNLPEDVAQRLTEAKLMKDLGVSDETVFDYIPTVKDVKEELKRSEEQSQRNFDRFQANMTAKTEEETEEVEGEDVA